MKQTVDFLAECEALSAVLDPLDGDDLARPTQFKGWRIEDVIVHLHFGTFRRINPFSGQTSFPKRLPISCPIFKNGACVLWKTNASHCAVQPWWKHGAIIIGIFACDWMGLIPKCG